MRRLSFSMVGTVIAATLIVSLSGCNVTIHVGGVAPTPVPVQPTPPAAAAPPLQQAPAVDAETPVPTDLEATGSTSGSHLAAVRIETLRVVRTDGQGLNLRAAPSVAASRTKHLPEGAAVETVGPDVPAEGRTWRNVRDPAGVTGWVAAEFLAAGAASAQVTANPTAAPTTDRRLAGGVRFVANTDGLGVRIRPVCDDQARVGLWPEGTRVVVEYARDDCPGWLWVARTGAESSWVRLTYLSETAPSVAAPPAVSSPAQAKPAGAAGTRPTFTIHDALVPAWFLLTSIPATSPGTDGLGVVFKRMAESAQVRIIVADMGPGAAGSYRGRDNTIRINPSVLREDQRAQATVIAHELVHASQITRSRGIDRDCVRMEVDAFEMEAIVWGRLWGGPGPGRTLLERNGRHIYQALFSRGIPGLYSLVVNSPGYQQQCELWVP